MCTIIRILYVWSWWYCKCWIICKCVWQNTGTEISFFFNNGNESPC